MAYVGYKYKYIHEVPLTLQLGLQGCETDGLGPVDRLCLT